MPTYEVSLSSPVLVSVTVEATDPEEAREIARDTFKELSDSLSPDDFTAQETPGSVRVRP